MKKKKHTSKRRKSFVTNPSRRRTVAAAPSHRRRRRAAYVANPSRRRHYRKNPGDTPKDIAVTIGSGVVAAVAGPKLVSMLPVPNLVQNLAMIAGGLGLAYFGRKKQVLIGAGAGFAIAGASRAVISAVPTLAGDNEMTQDEQTAFIDSTAQELMGNDYDEGDEMMGGPLAGPLAGPLNGGFGASQLI